MDMTERMITETYKVEAGNRWQWDILCDGVFLARAHLEIDARKIAAALNLQARAQAAQEGRLIAPGASSPKAVIEGFEEELKQVRRELSEAKAEIERLKQRRPAWLMRC